MWRDGFALVDVLVALLVLTAGVLALAAMTTAVVAQMNAADARAWLREQARLEMERLVGQGTVEAGSGERYDWPYRVSWRVYVGDLREIRVIAEHGNGRGVRSDTLATLVGSR